MDIPAQEETKLTLSLAFCFAGALGGLDGAHPHWEGVCFPQSLIQV